MGDISTERVIFPTCVLSFLHPFLLAIIYVILD